MGHVGPSHSRTTEYSALPYSMAEMTSLICTDVSSCQHGLSTEVTDLVVSHKVGGKVAEDQVEPAFQLQLERVISTQC